jgi:hypothetical protein
MVHRWLVSAREETTFDVGCFIREILDQAELEQKSVLSGINFSVNVAPDDANADNGGNVSR